MTGMVSSGSTDWCAFSEFLKSMLGVCLFVFNFMLVLYVRVTWLSFLGLCPFCSKFCRHLFGCIILEKAEAGFFLL